MGSVAVPVTDIFVPALTDVTVPLPPLAAVGSHHVQSDRTFPAVKNTRGAVSRRAGAGNHSRGERTFGGFHIPAEIVGRPRILIGS